MTRRLVVQGVDGRSTILLAFGSGNGKLAFVSAETKPGSNDRVSEPITPPSVRYHALDAVRAFALLLGVVYHAAESFEQGHLAWAIVDGSTSLVLHVFRMVSHSFRLEVFFVIAGYFARLVVIRRGERGFWVNRLQRILVPLVAGWLVLYPLIILVWISGALKSGNFTFIPIPEEVRSAPAWLLTAGFFMSGAVFDRFNLTHLWFLYQLLVIYALVLGTRRVLLRWIDSSGIVFARMDRAMALITRSRWSALAFAGSILPWMQLMQGWDVDTPYASLIPEAGPTLLYGFCFLVGWMWHRQPSLLGILPRRAWFNLTLGLFMLLPLGPGLEWFTDHAGLHRDMPMFRLMFQAFYSVMMWGLVLGVIGLFLRYRSSESAAWRYVADASYWIYIVHLPIVVGLQVWMAQWPLHWTVKFPLITAISLAISFLTYDAFVRSTRIGMQLNGRRYPSWIRERLRAARGRRPAQRDVAAP